MSNDADTRTARNGARLSSGLRVVSRRGYGPTHERLSVCSCLGALGVNVRICRDPRFRLSQISWRTSGRITRRRTNLSACQALLCEDLLYIQLQGRAPRAGPEAGRRSGESAARQRRWLSSGAASAHRWLATGGPRRARRRLPSFGPFGPRRRRRATRPRGRPHGQRAATSAVVRELQEGPSLRRPHPEALQDQPQGRACGASLRFAPRRPLRLSLVRDSEGAYRRNGQVRILATSVATSCSKHPESCGSEMDTWRGSCPRRALSRSVCVYFVSRGSRPPTQGAMLLCRPVRWGVGERLRTLQATGRG